MHNEHAYIDKIFGQYLLLLKLEVVGPQTQNTKEGGDWLMTDIVDVWSGR